MGFSELHPNHLSFWIDIKAVGKNQREIAVDGMTIGNHLQSQVESFSMCFLCLAGFTAPPYIRHATSQRACKLHTFHFRFLRPPALLMRIHVTTICLKASRSCHFINVPLTQECNAVAVCVCAYVCVVSEYPRVC